MIKIAMVEDDQTCALRMKEFVEQYENCQDEKIELNWFKDGLAFLDEYTTDYDVIFMDIEMPHMNGLDVAKKLRELDPNVALVFVTVMAQFAIAGYSVDAMDFVVKPITYLNFCMKLDKAIKYSKKNRKSVFKMTDSEGFDQYISSSDIYYIESFNHYIVFHTAKGDFRRIGTILKIQEQFGIFGFLRCNNSTVINPSYVTKLAKDSIVIRNTEIPITRSRKKEFMQKFTGYYKYIY